MECVGHKSSTKGGRTKKNDAKEWSEKIETISRQADMNREL